MTAEPYRTFEDRQLDLIRPNYPDWDIWFVTRYCQPAAWCARPKGSRMATVNTDSPEKLVEAINWASRAG